MKEENEVDCIGKHGTVVPMHYRTETLESSLSGCRSKERADSVTLQINEEAFAVFYHSTVRPLWAYLSRVSGNPTLTDDLVQESYLRFLCARAPWQEGAIACRRYLFRIGTNLLRDQWRRPAGRSLQEIPEMKLPFIDPPNVEEMDSNEVLNAALLQLRPVERQLLWLAHAEEMSYREIVDYRIEQGANSSYAFPIQA